MSREYIWQQQQTLFAPVPPLAVQPDLRVHAKRDNIVFTPDEPYTEVPGDHFSLVFYPFMIKKLKELYAQYKAYVRVDLVMYAVMVLLIIIYFIYTVAF